MTPQIAKIRLRALMPGRINEIMKINRFLVYLTIVSAGFLLDRTLIAQEMFPFVIPGSTVPATNSVVDVSWLNDEPAGSHGFVRVQDGHFVDGRGRRLRFLATNFTFGSCFPDHDMADKLAARLASLGINCIRFHHTDNAVAPRGIWKAGTQKRNELDPDQLDRLDYFIAALKRHGIYANINLHISRNYWEGEDFPDGLANNRERQERLPNYGKAIDKINDQMIRMQHDYARALLTHVNAYTHNTYASEPCVAVVEINNENSLLQLKVASLPKYYRDDVLNKWNRWLKTRYGSSEKLVAAWGGHEKLGDNILPAKLNTQGGEYFAVTNTSKDEIHVSLHKAPEVSWHAQLHWPGLTLKEGQLYTVEFSARSDSPRKLPISTRLNKEDWHNCGLSDDADLGPEWKTFSYAFRATHVEPDNVRFDIVLGGGAVGDFWIRNLTLRRGGSLGLKAGESLEAGNIEAPVRTQGTPRGLDWTRFLAQTERSYTDGMRTFLKKELGVRASIIDTQASYGGIIGTYRESFNDYVDMHAYWQHPHFPGKPWDGSNWNIPNTPMVADKNGGNLLRLAVYRVAGKPFTVSEYDHPAPSQYAAEMYPVIASFAALQDWDAIFQFDWGGTEPDAQRITGYFSLQQHPGKLAFLPAAALMFRRGDVPAARAVARLTMPVVQAEKFTAENVSMPEAWKKAGVSIPDLLNHRLELRFAQKGELKAEMAKASASPLAWDSQDALYTVDALAAKALVGRCTGKSTKLSGAEFDVKSNPRDFAVIAVNAADGKPLAQSRRLLVTAVGDVENTGMGWNENHTSVGTHWGHAPTVCESIAARITLTTTARRVTIYSLDGNGARVGQVPGTITSGKLSLEIGSQFKTLWYEVVLE